MYHTIRRIHLFTGLLLLLCVIMYFFTGYVIIHNKWFGGNNPKVTNRTEAVNYTGEKSDEAMSLYLQQTFDLAGKRNPAKARPGGEVQFVYVHPGTRFEAILSADAKQVAITRRDMNFVGIAGSMHQLNGYGGGGFYYLWALMLDLASAAMVIFAFSGIYLWYKSTAGRLAGWVFFGTGCSYTVAMILYFLYHK